MKKCYQRPRYWRLAKKRRARLLKRRRKKSIKSNRGGNLINGQYITSNILEFLRMKVAINTYPKMHGQSLIIKIPKTFSFIHDPKSALAVVSQLLCASNMNGYKRLVMDHSDCEKMDLCASVVLDIIVMEIMKEWRACGADRRPCGFLSKSEEINNRLRCTGLLHHLRIKGQEASKEIENNFVKFPLRKGYKPQGRELRSTAQEKAADDLAKHFDHCLKKFGYSLSPDGQAFVIQVVGEVIDNAERHSGRGKWWAMGYMDQNGESGVGECELTVVCFGSTIYESLRADGLADALRADLNKLTSIHNGKGLLGIKAGFTEENLWTLYALQDGVSRFAYKKPGSGSGTVQMIEAFQGLGKSLDKNKQSAMAVVSGSTRILFDGKYKMQKNLEGGIQRNTIAFNSSNDLHDKPDAKYVNSFPALMPGVVISLRFYLDQGYLDKLHANNNES